MIEMTRLKDLEQHLTSKARQFYERLVGKSVYYLNANGAEVDLDSGKTKSPAISKVLACWAKECDLEAAGRTLIEEFNLLCEKGLAVSTLCQLSCFKRAPRNANELLIYNLKKTVAPEIELGPQPIPEDLNEYGIVIMPHIHHSEYLRNLVWGGDYQLMMNSPPNEFMSRLRNVTGTRYLISEGEIPRDFPE